MEISLDDKYVLRLTLDIRGQQIVQDIVGNYNAVHSMYLYISTKFKETASMELPTTTDTIFQNAGVDPSTVINASLLSLTVAGELQVPTFV